MDQNSEAETVAAAYGDSLSDLNTIAKNEINALTMLAEDSREYAPHIVACIEDHLRAAPSKRKLPILYLIDSICKNFPKSKYVELFTQNIVSNFCKIFECSGEKTRKDLHKLRMTWGNTKTFPPAKLHAIDERVHKIDPNWPVMHRPARQRRGQQQASQQQPPQRQQPPQAQPQPQLQPQSQIVRQPDPEQQPHQQPLQPDSKELQLKQELELQQELQLQRELQMQQELQQQQQLLQQQQLQQQQQLLQQQQQMFQQQLQQQISLNHPLPDALSITLDTLYRSKQCSNCSLRFDDINRYHIHLDWHFRQNLKNDKTRARRKWYYPLDLWVKFREINDEEEEAQDNLDNNNGVDMFVNQNENEVPTAPAFSEDEKNICLVCNETFEKFWAEEEEEWRLRNAKMHHDQRVYHPLCLDDTN